MPPNLVGLLLGFPEDNATDGEAYMSCERFFTYRTFLANGAKQSAAF